MRVSVLQENLAKGLGIVNRAVSSRPSMPVLGNILLATEESRLKLSATNLELGITSRIGAKVETEGAITVPARTLVDLVNTLPPERVDLEVDTRTQTLNMRCGATVANIKGIEAEQFPEVPEAEADTGMSLPAPAFQAMINQVAFAAAKEDNRPILMGVLTRFEGSTFTMAAADGFRLALRSTQLETPVAKSAVMVVPARTLAELARIITPNDTQVYVSIPQGRSQVMFHLDDVDVVSQLIDGKFPDVDHLIPKSVNTMTTMQTDDLLNACKRAEIFARDANYTTRLRIKPAEGGGPGQIVVMAQSQEKGDNEGVLDGTINGPGLEISFNVRYLIEVLNVLTEEQVVLETQGPAQPGVVKPAGLQGFIYVLMPMSVR